MVYSLKSIKAVCRVRIILIINTYYYFQNKTIKFVKREIIHYYLIDDNLFKLNYLNFLSI